MKHAVQLAGVALGGVVFALIGRLFILAGAGQTCARTGPRLGGGGSFVPIVREVILASPDPCTGTPARWVGYVQVVAGLPHLALGALMVYAALRVARLGRPAAPGRGFALLARGVLAYLVGLVLAFLALVVLVAGAFVNENCIPDLGEGCTDTRPYTIVFLVLYLAAIVVRGAGLVLGFWGVGRLMRALGWWGPSTRVPAEP